jgi:hypothetical protein
MGGVVHFTPGARRHLTRFNTQIAYHESDASGSHTTWGRHVTDEEYSGLVPEPAGE